MEEPFTAKLLARLLPVIVWITGFCAQTLAALLYIRFGKDTLKLRPKGKIFWIILAYFAGVFLVWIWATRSVIPVASEKVGWNLLGSPILESQVLLAWAPGVLLLLLVNRFNTAALKPAWLKKLTPRKIDLAIACLIWLCAVVLWQSTPITPNWFLSEKLHPNRAYYPYSDARHYDRVAQSALIGEGFKFFNGWDVRRPLHGAYLTILHLIAGQDYEKVIALQVLLLALLPVLLYFLTKSLHNRALRGGSSGFGDFKRNELDLDNWEYHHLQCQAADGRFVCRAGDGVLCNPGSEMAATAPKTGRSTNRAAIIIGAGQRRRSGIGNVDPAGDSCPVAFSSADRQPDPAAEEEIRSVVQTTGRSSSWE